jgi:hypothetical protein
MGKGPGKWQKLIIEALIHLPVFELWRILPELPANPSSYNALHRAAKTLEKQGKCVTLLLWDDDHRHLYTSIARPGLVVDGKPIKGLSVEIVQNGTGSTYKGSCRYIAGVVGLSKSTVHRDLTKGSNLNGS